jgi:ribosomal protein S18 acetylase RimI-like enzyme
VCEVIEPGAGSGSAAPNHSAVEIALLPQSRWQFLRSLRLVALQDSPAAFGSDFQQELGWSADAWASTFESSVWVVALDGPTGVGLLRSTLDLERSSGRNVESVWVAPGYRRRGICRLMFAKIIEYERESGASELRAWVLDGNSAAPQAYQRLGFVATGEQQRFPANGRLERRMMYRISDAAPE